MQFKSRQIQIEDDNTIIVSTTVLAKIYGVTQPTISAWQRKGMPHRGNGGWFELSEVAAWKNSTTELGDNVITDADKLEADVKLKRAKEELTRIEIAVKNGQLVEISTVMSVLEQEFIKLKTYMLGIGDRVMSDIVLQYPELATQVRRTINDNIRTGLTELANSRGNIKPAETSKPRKKAGRPRKTDK